MPKMRKLAVATATMLWLAAPAAAARPTVGQPAPPFTVETFDGQTVTLASLRGKVVVLNLWATWCAPCRQELPLLDAYSRLRKDAGLEVLALTTEASAPLRRLKPLAAVVSFPLVRRMKGPYATLGAVPTNSIIDRAGVVRYAKTAAFTLHDLDALLVPLLNEPAPPQVARVD